MAVVARHKAYIEWEYTYCVKGRGVEDFKKASPIKINSEKIHYIFNS